eukprot:2344919-Prymnesium_polylepis.1
MRSSPSPRTLYRSTPVPTTAAASPPHSRPDRANDHPACPHSTEACPPCRAASCAGVHVQAGTARRGDDAHVDRRHQSGTRPRAVMPRAANACVRSARALSLLSLSCSPKRQRAPVCAAANDGSMAVPRVLDGGAGGAAH